MKAILVNDDGTQEEFGNFIFFGFNEKEEEITVSEAFNASVEEISAVNERMTVILEEVKNNTEEAEEEN